MLFSFAGLRSFPHFAQILRTFQLSNHKLVSLNCCGLTGRIGCGLVESLSLFRVAVKGAPAGFLVVGNIW